MLKLLIGLRVYVFYIDSSCKRVVTLRFYQELKTTFPPQNKYNPLEYTCCKYLLRELKYGGVPFNWTRRGRRVMFFCSIFFFLLFLNGEMWNKCLIWKRKSEKVLTTRKILTQLQVSMVILNEERPQKCFKFLTR